MAGKKKEDKLTIVIPRIKISTVSLLIESDPGSSLICSRFPKRTMDKILNKQMQKARSGEREAKDPNQMYKESLYILNGSKKGSVCFGFPSIGFKLACVNACRHVDDLAMTFIREALHIFGGFVVDSDPRDFVKIEGTPTKREDIVRIPTAKNKPADVVFRGEFKDWSALLNIRFASSKLSQQQVIDLINIAGSLVGVGAWTPSHNGEHGLFHVVEKNN